MRIVRPHVTRSNHSLLLSPCFNCGKTKRAVRVRAPVITKHKISKGYKATCEDLVIPALKCAALLRSVLARK